jgi:hypothetical protein
LHEALIPQPTRAATPPPPDYTRGESGNNSRIVSRLKHLQTGSGTVQIAAISTAAITAVIFSLVDRLMASSERDANLSAVLYAASHAYAVTVITLRPATSRVYRRARLSALAGGGAFGCGVGFGAINGSFSHLISDRPAPAQASPAARAADRAAAPGDIGRLR